jgi:hypothetical protein
MKPQVMAVGVALPPTLRQVETKTQINQGSAKHSKDQKHGASPPFKSHNVLFLQDYFLPLLKTALDNPC